MPPLLSRDQQRDYNCHQDRQGCDADRSPRRTLETLCSVARGLSSPRAPDLGSDVNGGGSGGGSGGALPRFPAPSAVGGSGNDATEAVAAPPVSVGGDGSGVRGVVDYQDTERSDGGVGGIAHEGVHYEQIDGGSGGGGIHESMSQRQTVGGDSGGVYTEGFRVKGLGFRV